MNVTRYQFPVPTEIAEPIKNTRQWTTALSPRIGGGWDFITQLWEKDQDVPTEWVVVNLDTEAVSLVQHPNQVYSNTNFQVPCASLGIVDANQLRAPSGRIFFPMRFGHIGGDLTDEHYVNVAYYDPASRTVTDLPSLLSPGGTRQTIVIQAVFDHAGNKLYMGTQATVGALPFVFVLDPVTLAITVIGLVGAAASGNVKYAYYLAKDEGPGAQWLYVAVGQDPWELVKIDVNTGAMTVLYTTTDPDSKFIEFENRPGLGWSVHIIDGAGGGRWWLADGAMTAYPGSGAPPGGARDVTPYNNALIEPPEIDWSRGAGHVQWRPHLSTDAFTDILYTPTFIAGVVLESMLILTDGSIIGAGENYNGFFRRSPSGDVVWFGAWYGVSQAALLQKDASTVYMCGYANSALLLFTPGATWELTPIANPASVGSYFATTGVKYPYFLELGANGRLYMTGRRERDASGSGIGHYTASTGLFAGTNDAPLDNYKPRGFAVLDGISRIAFSGETLDSSDARILMFDLNLTPTTSWLVQAGLKNTGLLYETSDPAVVIGLTNDIPYYVYRFNVQTGALLQIVTLGLAVGASCLRASDGSLWAVVGTNIERIDPATLARQKVAGVGGIPTVVAMSFLGNKLYMVAGSKLYRLAVS